MIVDFHIHFFRPESGFGPRLRADMARCGVDPDPPDADTA